MVQASDLTNINLYLGDQKLHDTEEKLGLTPTDIHDLYVMKWKYL